MLTVATGAVRGAATPTPWILAGAGAGGRLARRNVTLGIRGEGHTEIISGLGEGAELVLTSDATLVDGQRVRARPGDR